MTEVRLRPMREDEFDAWRSWAVREYADDMMRNRSMPDEAALSRAAKEMDELLTAGISTPGHHLLVAEDDVTGDRVGYLWYGPRSSGADPNVAWLYDVYVEEELRGGGLGRRLMEALEVQVRSDGHHRIELNVFGDNDRARRLYDSMGYREMARQMAKELD